MSHLDSRILSTLIDDEPWSATDVAEAAGVSCETAATVLRRLEREGVLTSGVSEGRTVWSRV